MISGVVRRPTALLSMTLGGVKRSARYLTLGHTYAAASSSIASKPHFQSFFSREQIEHFNSNGYVVAPSDFLDEREKESVVRWATELSKWHLSKGKWTQYFEAGSSSDPVLCRIENFLQYHRSMDQFVRGKITEAVSELINEPAVLYKEKINFKFPGAKGFPAHQDAPAYISFGMKYHVTCLLCADPATEENGCLQVVPRHPSLGMLPHPNGQLDPELVQQWERENAWVSLPAEVGDAIFFDSLVPHRSMENRSKTESRRIFYLTFNPLQDGDRREGYYNMKREMFPPDNEKVPGRDYSEGAKIFNLSTPIRNKKD
ncbi:2-aminoethylphosphonate dioxygenase-like [Sycon ciliatum]|uniref:2-aminoethylphosphonate dioxygenase-like n=1 Tax=Sycon ciliatum TaxID=27933 RepID=UPI0031F716F9